MKLYLSSYRLGNHPNELKKLINKENPRVAVSVNALDFLDPEVRNNEFLKREIEDMRNLGFSAEELDLRDYFHNNSLAEKMKEYDAVWFSGGNVFILAKAFKQSGFDTVIEKQVKTGKLVYAGYSAAFCVLTTSLHGIELVDDKDATAEGYETGEIWEGIGLIDFYPIVHFRSDHEESELVEKEYEYVVKNNIPHKTFKDGDVYLIDEDIEKTLT
ncbi:Type 1 glutamine amidotransferase-like domain-containing protein [Patescibacteria group bacterium]|nr:Type 1 glutamine amidotransferase-like domain-containing protein [Patescibacteria group bacterium]